MNLKNQQPNQPNSKPNWKIEIFQRETTTQPTNPKQQTN